MYIYMNIYIYISIYVYIIDIYYIYKRKRIKKFTRKPSYTRPKYIVPSFLRTTSKTPGDEAFISGISVLVWSARFQLRNWFKIFSSSSFSLQVLEGS